MKSPPHRRPQGPFVVQAFGEKIAFAFDYQYLLIRIITAVLNNLVGGFRKFC